MPEIAHTFRRVERSNERANASLQPFDRALRRLAQQCLQGMEHQLYWVELRRILRQVAQFCAASLDCLRTASPPDDGSGRAACVRLRGRTSGLAPVRALCSLLFP